MKLANTANDWKLNEMKATLATQNTYFSINIYFVNWMVDFMSKPRLTAYNIEDKGTFTKCALLNYVNSYLNAH